MSHLKKANMYVNLNSDNHLVINLPDSWALRVISRSLFVAAFILTVPFIGSILKEISSSDFDEFEFNVGPQPISFEFVDTLFRDLELEGLLKKDDRVLVVDTEIAALSERLPILNHREIDLAIESSSESQSLVPGGAFDFVLLSSLLDQKFADRVLKLGGIMTVMLGGDHLNIFQEPSNYKVVYLRRFDSTIVAMRKTALLNGGATFQTNRKLCGVVSEAKRAVLRGLEKPLLEPPRRPLLRSDTYFKGIKYLPHLLDDTLEGYRPRVFITLGTPEDNKRTVQWFYQKYPLRNLQFRVYNLETLLPSGVSDWLMKNVEEEEYVVMKAEAAAVEELMKKRTIHLVDELFLECKNRWEYKERNKSKRAYWECLALYGRFKDEGVAVHQWWG